MIALLQIEAMVWVLFYFNDLDSLAMLDGPRLIVAPAILIIIAWGNLVGPMAAKHYKEEGLASLRGFMFKASSLLIGSVVLLVALVLLMPTEYLGKIVNVKYLSDWSTLVFWGLIAVAMAFSTAVSTVFFATHNPKYSLYSRVISGFVGLPCYVVFIAYWGVLGAVIARLVVEVIQSGVVFINVKNLVSMLERKSAECAGIKIEDTEEKVAA